MTLIGLSFPFQSNSEEFPAVAYGDDVIKASLIQILVTGRGERVMRPAFGCRAFDFVFENDDNALRIIIEREVRSAVNTWEKRVRVEEVNIETDAMGSPGQIIITVVYTILASNQVQSLTVGGE